MTVNLVAGWTEPIRDQLFADGVIQDLTGMTVVLDAWMSGAQLTLNGVAAIESPATSGIVRFTPAVGDIVKGTMKIRWRVTDSTGAVSYFPNSQTTEIWKVYLP